MDKALRDAKETPMILNSDILASNVILTYAEDVSNSIVRVILLMYISIFYFNLILLAVAGIVMEEAKLMAANLIKHKDSDAQNVILIYATLV